MTGNEYQKCALRTANDIDQIPYGNLIVGVLGLSGETGEITDHVKKFLGQGHELNRDHIIEECGDLLWYVAITLHAVGCDMDTAMVRNVEKLKERYPDGFTAEKSIHRKEYLPHDPH